MVCFVEWTFYGFLQYEGLTPHQQRVVSIVGPILSVVQFPSFQLDGFETDVPAIVACLLMGYLLGLTLGCLAGPQVVRPRPSALVWWIALVVVTTDLVCILVLSGHILDAISLSTRVFFLLIPVTVIVGILLWPRLRVSGLAREPAAAGRIDGKWVDSGEEPSP
jgi:hypothetical protein